MGFFIGLIIGAALVLGAIRGRSLLGISVLVERFLSERNTPRAILDTSLPKSVNDPHEGVTDIFEVAAETPAVHVEDQPAEITQDDLDSIRIANSASEAKEIARRLIRNPDVADLFLALAGWEPKWFHKEDKYHADLKRYLKKEGYAGRIVDKQPVPWRITGKDESRTAKPDFIIGDPAGPSRRKILVELKANLFNSTEVDRALGQMLRYLIAWKQCGPAVLLIGGYVSPELVSLIRWYIKNWRDQMRLPVTVYFVRETQSTAVNADDDLLMPDEEAEG